MEEVNILETKRQRHFLPSDFKVESWEKVKPYYEELLNRKISSGKELEQWILDRNELEAVLQEDLAWRYIKMSIDTTNKQYVESFHFYIENISPNASIYEHKLNLKLYDSAHINSLDQSKYYIYLREIKKDIEIFREENIPLQTEISKKSREYGSITGAMTIEWEGKTLTLQQAAKFLKSPDRGIRKAVYEKIVDRRLQDKEKLEELFDELIGLRHRVALNAGFDNYRDYMFKAMGRFDYTPQDCFLFHKAIEDHIVPLVQYFDKERKGLLGYESLKPYDTDVDPEGLEPLKPFETAEELIEKTIRCFSRLDEYFANCIATMDKMGHLDLESRVGKAPGGFNYPLYETGVPFIFMNAVGTHRDLVTMVHEGGHAVHSFLTAHYPVNFFKSVPSEVAELASMGMEMLSMSHWDVFYPDKSDYRRAQKDQLQGVIKTLPWVATIDAFQHWIYTHPGHTRTERKKYWEELMKRFGSSDVDWTGYDEALQYLWQKQLHLYEVPFYYIEYGMAQLGAIALWINFLKNPALAIEKYKKALSLGYTRPIGDIYNTAGIRFDFKSSYVEGLANAVKEKYEQLN